MRSLHRHGSRGGDGGESGVVGLGLGRLGTGMETLEMPEMEMDGLLCDVTVEGIQRWVAEVGERSVGVEVSLVVFFLILN